MFQDNVALRRCLRASGHPVTILCVLLLLVNDHVLRILWPSWWTGKLGDAAWLTFFPLVLAVPVALIVPTALKRQQDFVAGISFGLTGLAFSLMKTIPSAMYTGLWVLRNITGQTATLRVDPTDMLALPALLAGWWIWQQSARPSSALRGWAIMALGALATVANTTPASRMDNRSSSAGVEQVQISSDDALMAIRVTILQYAYISHDGYSSWQYISRDYHFVSQDGGLSWQRLGWQPEGIWESSTLHINGETWDLTDPDNDNIVYRFNPGRSIERSEDGGATWKTDLDVHWSQAELYFNRLSPDTRGHTYGGPFSAVINRQSGTMVVAMGGEGVVTRTRDGEWHWATVDTGDRKFRFSHFLQLKSLNDYYAVLTIHFWLGVSLLFLVPGSLKHAVEWDSPSVGSIIASCIAWGGWWIEIVFFPFTVDPAVRGGFLAFLPLVVAISHLYGLTGLSPVVTLFGTITREVWDTTLGATALFTLMFVLWSLDVIPDITRTTILATVLMGVVIIWGGWRVWKRTKGFYKAEGQVE